MFDSKKTVQTRGDHSVGNIYDRLDAARRKREQILDPPTPANDDRRAITTPTQLHRPFPKLKPPRTETMRETVIRRWDWVVPWLLGAAIFALIFGFAVR